LVEAVMFTGGAQVLPLSSFRESQTVRVPPRFRTLIWASPVSPGLCVSSSQMIPVVSSTTGQGLPHVFGPSSQTTCGSLQVLPPSAERFSSRSMLPVSERLFFRPLAKGQQRLVAGDD
jgi:hypothetical protein